MNKSVKSCLILVMVFVIIVVAGVAVMFFADLCPPQGPWPMPPWCASEVASPSVQPTTAPAETQPIAQFTSTPEIITVDLTISVPYWTQGDVYLGIGDNPAFLKLERVNEATYKGTASLNKDAEYYYSRGTLETKSINTFKPTDLPQGLNAVIDWADSAKGYFAIRIPERCNLRGNALAARTIGRGWNHRTQPGPGQRFWN